MKTDPRNSKLSRSLAASPDWVFVTVAVLAAFSTYFCMYGFRKAFAAASFEGAEIAMFGLVLDLKLALVIGQVLGYAASKFIGIKVNSEMTRGRRGLALFLCVLASQFSLVAFALVPPEFKVLAIFCSALPLGMVWGLVFSFLEGRSLTDLLGAGLCCSFILASGFAKSVGAWVMQAGVSEEWMPAVAGLFYLPPYCLAVWLLRRLPHPTEVDVARRVDRQPMGKVERRAFLKRYGFGIACLMPSKVTKPARQSSPRQSFRSRSPSSSWSACCSSSGATGPPCWSTMSTAWWELPFSIPLRCCSSLAESGSSRGW